MRISLGIVNKRHSTSCILRSFYTGLSSPLRRQHPTMVSPLMNMLRSTDRRNKLSPVGMTVVSPTESVSPLDTRMTPTRRMLFQRKRLTSNQGTTDYVNEVSDVEESRDDIPYSNLNNELYHLRSANKKKDGQLRLLHERFNHIQNGLGTIDDERTNLLEKAKKLEKEKKLIQKQLQLREREILALVKRCASQEEKMRESSKLRSENRLLQDHLDAAQRRLHDFDEGQEDLYSLKKKLQESEMDREHLQDRLAKVQREHDCIADTLQECLAKIRHLTEEKQQIEEERRRERKRAEIELEKQRLAHVNDSNNLKEDIQLQKTRIHQMEKILQDNMYTNTALRREKAMFLSQGQHGAAQDDVIQLYERQLSELRQQIDETAREKEMKYEEELSVLRKQVYDEENHGHKKDRHHDFEEEIKFMKEKLEEKDCLIEGLEMEFSEQMSELMSKQSSLDEAEEEKQLLKDKVNSMKNIETEHAALLDFVQILDSNLADLTTENAHLILEKDTLREEAEDLRTKAEILQNQLRSLQDNKKARESDFRDLLKAEKEELHAELEATLKDSREEVAALQAELESRSEWIFKVEGELKDARRKIVEKDHEIGRIMNEMEVLRSTLTLSLRTARIEVAHLEAEVFARDQHLASLEGRIQTAKETAETEKQTVTIGKVDLTEGSGSQRLSVTEVIHVDDHRDPDQSMYLDEVDNSDLREASLPEDDIVSLRLQLRTSEMESEKFRSELEGRIQEVQNEALLLQQEITSLHEARSSLEEEVDASRSLINGRDEQILSLQQALLSKKKRENELARQLEGMKRAVKSKEQSYDCNSEKQLQVGSSLSSQPLTNEESLSTSGFWSLDADKNLIDSSVIRKLRQDLDETHSLLSKSEQRVAELEQQYAETKMAREESAASLHKAKKRISDLEAQLSGDAMNEHAISLERELNEAKSVLFDQETKACTMEDEFTANLHLQSARENYTREAYSRIAVLEERIAEMNHKSIELEIKVKESKYTLEERDAELLSLRDHIAKGEQGQTVLHSQLDQRAAEVKSLESSLATRDKSLTAIQREMEIKMAVLSEKENRIGELENLVENSDSALHETKLLLSEAQERTKSLEEEISSYESKMLSLEEQLQDASNAATKNESCFEEKERIAAEISLEYARLESQMIASEKLRSDLEERLSCSRDEIAALNEKVESLVAGRSVLVSELQNANTDLEHERQALQTNEANFGLERQALREELSSVHANIIDKEAKIKSLQDRLKENQEMYGSLERTLDEARKTVETSIGQKEAFEKKCNELENEFRETRDLLNEKYHNLEQEHEATRDSLAQRDLLLSALQQTENESEGQKSILSSQLSDAKDEIICLEREMEVRGKMIECLEREIEDLSSSEIELAFVESEKRRIHLEGELANAQRQFQDLAKSMEDREKRLLEVDHELEQANKQVAAERKSIHSSEHKCNDLQDKVRSLDEMLGVREERLMKVDQELETVKQESQMKDETIQELKSSIVGVEEALKIATEELSKQLDIVGSLRDSFEVHKKDMEKAEADRAMKADRIESLEQNLMNEKAARKSIESDFSLLKRNFDVLQISKDVAKKELEEKILLASRLDKELSETKGAFVELDCSSKEVTTKLEAQVQKITTDLALRDDEIRELRLVELKDAEEIIAMLTEEVNALKEEALHKNLERTAEKGRLTHDINYFKSTLEALSSETEKDRENNRKEASAMISSIESLRSAKKELERRIQEQYSKLDEHDRTIQALKQSLYEGEKREMEVREDRDLLLKSEEEARDEIENLKTELELSVLREQEMTDMKLRNQDAIHTEEMEQALSELQSTLEKLKEAELLLAERSNLLSEMVDHNRDLESKLEKEQADLRHMESKFAQGRVDLEETRRDLKKTRDELRRRENVLESKLKEEIEHKDFAEKSLKLVKAKYSEAVKTHKSIAELEKQNTELRDKVRRQEAYMQRKLQKEKDQRDRLTPTKGITSQSDRLTPTKSVCSQSSLMSPSKTATQTPTRRAGNNLLPPSGYSTLGPPRSRLPVPTTVRASGIPTGASAATSTFSTPAKKTVIGDKNATSDRSVASELSSILRTPTPRKGGTAAAAVQKSRIPDWELEVE